MMSRSRLSCLPDDIIDDLKRNLCAASCAAIRATSKRLGCHLISEDYLTRRLDDAIHNKKLSGVLTCKKPPTTALAFLLHFATAVYSGTRSGLLVCLAKLSVFIFHLAVGALLYFFAPLYPLHIGYWKLVEVTVGSQCKWLSFCTEIFLLVFLLPKAWACISPRLPRGWWLLPDGSVILRAGDILVELAESFDIIALSIDGYTGWKLAIWVLLLARLFIPSDSHLKLVLFPADILTGIFSGDIKTAAGSCIYLCGSVCIVSLAWLNMYRLLGKWLGRIVSERPMGRVEYLLRLLHVIEDGGCWDRTVQVICYLKNSHMIPSLPITITPGDLRQVGSRALFDSRPPAVRQLSLISHRLVPGLSLQRTPNGQDHLGEWLRHDRQVLTFLPIEALMPTHLPFSCAARAAAAMKRGSEHLADAAKGTVVGCLGRQVRALAALPPEQLSMRIDEFKGSLTGSADILSPAYCPSCNDEEARVLDDMATLAALAERLDGQQRKALHQLLGAGGKDSVLFPLIHSANVKVKDAAAALKGTLTDEIATLSVYQSDPPTKRLNYIYSSFTDFILYLVAHAPTAPRPYKLTPDSFLSPSEQHQLAGKLRFALIHNVVLDCRKAHKADERAFDGLTRDNRDEAIVILCGERARDDFAASLWVVRRDYATCQTLSFEIFTTETPAGSKRCTQQRFPRTAALIRDKLEA